MESHRTETPRDRLRIFSRTDWQMPLGDRAALEAVVAQIRPAIAIEIGTAQGGSLERIALHSGEVHAFDLTGEGLDGLPENASFHEGDSRETLSAVLERIAADGGVVEFALVDGDHSRAGVRADLEALLGSPACRGTVILLHDAFNAAVRDGIRDALAEAEDVVDSDLDLTSGRRFGGGPLAGQLWGGFAIVLAGPAEATRPLPVVAGQIPGLGEVEYAFEDSHATLGGGEASLRRELEEIHSSASWRLTAPLRALRRRAGR